MNFISNLRLKYKFLIVFSTIIIFTITTSGLSIYYFVKTFIISKIIEEDLSRNTNNIVNMVKTSADISIKTKIQAIAEKNLLIVDMLYNKYRSGEITEEDAKKRAASILLTQKIGKTGYVYCVDSNGFIKIHPKSEIQGNNYLKYPFIQKQIKLKNGFHAYEWKHKNEEKKRKKYCYLKYFKPWDWIISASSYCDEFYGIVNVESLKETILKIKFGETGYPYILNSKGTVLIHPAIKTGINFYNKKDASGNLFIKHICKTKNGKVLYPWKNPGEKKLRKKISIYKYIPEYDWIVASSAYMDEIYKPMNKLSLMLFLIVLITMIMSIFAINFITNRFIQSIFKITNTAKALSRYDLTVEIDDKKKDELGLLSNAIFKIVMQFRKIIVDAKNSSKELSETSKMLLDISSDLSNSYDQSTMQGAQITTASEQITFNLNSIASTSEEMTTNLEDINQRVEKMSQKINIVASSTEEMSLTMNNVRDNADQGARIAKEAMQQGKVVKDAITQLNESASEIDDVTNVIKQIADKTNLLALNASIEAASAGKAGKGFAVVANSIQQFADQSTEAAEDIAMRIFQVQEKTTAAIKAISKITEIVEKMNQSSESILSSADEQSNATDSIASAIIDIDTIAQDNVFVMNELEKGAKDINIRLLETSEGALQVYQNIQDVSQAAEHNKQTIKKINESIDHLNTISHKYRSLVGMFKT